MIATEGVLMRLGFKEMAATGQYGRHLPQPVHLPSSIFMS
jgi:hypothetical protein